MAFTVLLLVSLLASCGALLSGGDPAPREAEQLPWSALLSVDRDALLDNLIPDENLVEELRRESPDSPFAAAVALEQRGLPEAARRIYLLERDHATAPWNGYSAVRLASIAADRRQWLAAEGHSSQAVEMAPEFADGWYLLGEALYRQEQYSTLMELVARIPHGSITHFHRHSPETLAAEALLWRAVATYQLELQSEDALDEAFRAAFLTVPAGQIHTRLYLYLVHRSGALQRFSRDTATLMEVVYRAAVGEAGEAWRLIRRIDPGEFAELAATHPALVATLRRAHGGAGAAGEQWLRRAADQDSPGATALLLADVLESRGNRSEAMEVLWGAGLFRDWVQGAIRQQRALPEALEMLRDAGAPEEDLVLLTDRLLPAMIRSGQWDAIEALYHGVPEEMEGLRAHLAVVTTMAQRAGLLAVHDDDQRLAPALRQDPLSFFHLAGHMLHGTPVETAVSFLEDEPRDTWPPAFQYAGALLLGGLVEESRAIAMRAAEDAAKAPAALMFARRAARHGYASLALDVARRAVNRGDLAVHLDDIPLLYPRPFAPEIEMAAADYRVSAAVFYGLLREESHFNPVARSPVGAMGLAQIMPATGEDLQRRLGWTTVDLLSVSENVRMGAFYLDYLAEQLPDSPVLPLAAYNAGLGRGRTWSREFQDLPPLLQIEALPFIETRWYLRRIAVSAGWYHYLLTGENPAEHQAIISIP